MSGEDVMRRVREIHRAELKKSQAVRPGVGTPGLTEVQSPLESNRVKYNTWYYGSRVHGERFMWCAAYQAYIFAKAKVRTDIYPKAAAVPDVRDFFKARGRLFPTPMAGDLMIIIHDARHRHIGFVEELLDGGRFHSIEGNVNSRVMRVTRRRGESGIVGYGRPEYDKVEEDELTPEQRDALIRDVKGTMESVLKTSVQPTRADLVAGTGSNRRHGRAYPLVGAAAHRVADLAEARQTPSAALDKRSPPATALLGGALAGSGPGTSPCI